MELIANFPPGDLEEFLYERVSLWNNNRFKITVPGGSETRGGPSAQKRGRAESDSDPDKDPTRSLKGVMIDHW